jgi:hypothetical protein
LQRCRRASRQLVYCAAQGAVLCLTAWLLNADLKAI